MLGWTIIFFILAFMTVIFGFGDILAGIVEIGKLLLYLLVVIFVVLLIVSLIAGKKPPPSSPPEE